MLYKNLFLFSLLFSSLIFSQNQNYFYSNQNDKEHILGEDLDSLKSLFSKGKVFVRKIDKKSGYFTAVNLNDNFNDQKKIEDSVKLFIRFDNYCYIIVLFNEHFWIDDGNMIWNQDKTFAEMTLPQGTYQIFSYNENQAQNIFMMKENILVTQTDTIEINYGEAQNAVVLKNLDENGNFLPVIQEFYLNPTEIYFTRTGFHFVFWGFTFFNIYCSDFSEEVFFSSGLSWTDFLETHKNYMINHKVIKGLNASVTLINNPQDFVEHDLDALCNGRTDSVYIGHLDFVRFGGDTLLGVGGTVKIAGDIWKGKLFLTPFNSNYTGFCMGIFSFDNQNNLTLYSNAIQTESGFTFTYPIAGLNNAPPNIIKYPGESEISLGHIASYTDAILFNTENSILLENNYFGLTNEVRYKDRLNSYFKLFDEKNNLIAEGIIEDFPSLFLVPGNYFLKTTNNNFIIAGEPAELISNQYFDLRNEDKNPPYISSLNILDEQGVPVRKFEKNSNVKLSFSANDIEQSNFIIDSTKVLLRVSGTDEWQNISWDYILYDDRIGYIYESNLTPYTNYDSASIDLKFIFKDLFDNITELLLQPAVGIGKYGMITNVLSEVVNDVGSIKLNNYPNPFNPSTTIQYSITESGNVSLKIFNTLGEEVANLVNEYQQPGTYKINFNAEDLSTGIYFYSLQAGSFIETKKMILIR
jgi:hypothetical protein